MWCTQYDPPGSDDDLNEEYVCFENQGGTAANLSGWQVKDAANHTYTFPTFTLSAGTRVKLHTGSGTNTATDLYWGSGQFIWNNGGDTIFLYDNVGTLVDSYTY